MVECGAGLEGGRAHPSCLLPLNSRRVWHHPVGREDEASLGSLSGLLTRGWPMARSCSGVKVSEHVEDGDSCSFPAAFWSMVRGTRPETGGALRSSVSGGVDKRRNSDWLVYKGGRSSSLLKSAILCPGQASMRVMMYVFHMMSLAAISATSCQWHRLRRQQQ
jgi:hypothetical protein